MQGRIHQRGFHLRRRQVPCIIRALTLQHARAERAAHRARILQAEGAAASAGATSALASRLAIEELDRKPSSCPLLFTWNGERFEFVTDSMGAGAFDASGLAPLPDGWTRTFLLRADGYSKEMDINSAAPDAVEPLPFHGMTGYPYRTPERYPESAAHQRYRQTYNTRAAIRPLPSIESVQRK